jgi:hypothetical protein
MTAPKLPEGLEPVAWGTTRTKDGKQILSEMCVATNPAYVKVHNQHLWEPLYTATQMREAILAATERAATICDGIEDSAEFVGDTRAARTAEGCAAAIRGAAASTSQEKEGARGS